jgi:hypothetical protein
MLVTTKVYVPALVSAIGFPDTEPDELVHTQLIEFTLAVTIKFIVGVAQVRVFVAF